MEPSDREVTSAVHAQRVVRGFLGRLAAIRRANLVYEKIFDPRTHAYYYYNTYSFETTWQPPAVVTRILGEFGDLDAIAPTYTEEEAAVMLQAAWRRRRGLCMTRALLASVVSKVLDESTGAHYYFNGLSGETSWSKPALFGAEDVEDYPSAMLLAEGQNSAEPFGTGSYDYDQSQGWVGQEAWTKEHQEQEQQQHQQRAGGSSGDTNTAEEAGHEGWVWDDTSGWYYDEDLATQLLTGGVDVASKKGSDDGNVTASVEVKSESESERDTDSDSEEDGSDEQAGEKRKQRRKRRRRSLAPRNFPRSKAQRLVDEAEDSVDGARPEILNLSKLDMDRVTSRVYRLDWLQRLDLSNNRLYRISPDLAGMESLVDVNFRHNRIQAIPDELEALTKLKHLQLGHNRISGFRGNIYLISSLETLDLGHNRLKEVPLQVGDLQLLKRTREWEIGLRLLRELVTLDVSYNRLKTWPPQVEECRNLRDLRLDHNKLQEVPAIVGDNTALTNLNLSGNNLKGLPDTINSLSALTHLDLSDNKIETHSILPVGRKQKGPRLVSLEVLRLDRNRLTEGPEMVETFKTLTELDVSNNPIKNWSLDVSNLRKMKHLRLRGVDLDRCPEGIGHLNKLESLDFSENRIDTLDQSMAALFKLKKLGLRGNNIRDLGSCVGSMISLTSLDAGGNNLELISPELSRCTALETLDVSGGTISQLPGGLSMLTRLRVLRAQDNGLRAIPPDFKTLTALEELRLGGNQLSSLPASLHTLTKMRYAELSRNSMESPPPVTRQWPLLKHLVLSRNPLRGRHRQSLRLLQAAQRGHDAMHRGDWEEAARLLNVAAEAYEDVVHVVPDFPDVAGEGPPLAKTRPQDMDTFHHVNLAMAHLQGARKVAIEIDDMTGKTDGASGSSVAGSLSLQSVDMTEDSSMVTTSIDTGEREERRQKELERAYLREKRNHHHGAALLAFSSADQLEQLSRPMGRSAGVWLGRAAVAAEMGKPGVALDDLELALVQLRKNAKVRFLLAKSRIELGQYQRGLTDCEVASRLLDFEERLLGEREAEQERKEQKAESDRKTNERLAVRQRRAAEAEAEAKRLEESAMADVNEDKEETGEEGKSSIATSKADSSSPDGTRSDQSAAGDTVVTAIPSTEAAAVDSPEEGSEEAEPFTLTGDAVVAADSANSAKEMGDTLPTITEEEPPAQEAADVVGSSSAFEVQLDKTGDQGQAIDEKSHGERGDGGRSEVEPTSENKDPTTKSPTQNEETLQESPWLQEAGGLSSREKGLREGVSLGSASAGTAPNADGKRDQSNSVKESPARAELSKQRADIALLLAQAKEGMVYVAQSVDMADIKRGFVFTPHGVPVRDTAIRRELLRDGRSTLRTRHRRLLAVEAAKKRERARDAGLMRRAFRQADARQKAGRAAKARKAAAMAIYRDVQEAWEREQEEKESTKRIEAAKRRVELEVLAAAEEKAQAEAAQTGIDKGQGGGVETRVENDDARVESVFPVAAPGGTAESPSSSTPTTKPTNDTTKGQRQQKQQEDEEDEEEDDPELRKVLARRAAAGAKKIAGRRR